MAKHPTRFRQPELTGLRAIAALFVFLSHYGIWTANTHFKFEEGLVGVSIFFALSGYLITRTYLPRFMRAFPYKAYWRSRFARIYPAYFTLLILVYLGQGNLLSISPRQWFLNLTLLQGYFFPEIWTGLTPVAWSLTVEETFYLLAPFLFLAIRKATANVKGHSIQLRSIGVTIMGAVLVFAIEQLIHSTPDRGSFLFGFGMIQYSSIFGRFPEFALGISLALLLHGNATVAYSKSRIKAGFADLLFGVGILTGFYGCLIFVPYAKESDEWKLILVAFASCLLIASVQYGSRLAKLSLGSPLLEYLGKISYMTYLLNTETVYRLVNRAIESVSPALLQTPVPSYVAVIALSALGYELVEKPAHRILAPDWNENERAARKTVRKRMVARG